MPTDPKTRRYSAALPPLDDPDLRRRRARDELLNRLRARSQTEVDDEVTRDASGQPVGRRSPPRPRGGDAVVGYRRTLPGDSTSEDPAPPRAPDSSYSEDPEPPTAPQHSEAGTVPEAVLVNPPADLLRRARRPSPSRPLEVTAPGAAPIGIPPDHVRVYLERQHLACAMLGIVGLSALAGAGVAALLLLATVVRSAP